jgi:26S proteasome regulatory subunit N10
MKKNNVAIDIISFGADFDPSSLSALPSSSTTPAEPIETNDTKLLALHEAVNSSDNSHFITVETGPHLLSERISASAILRGDDGDAGEGGQVDEYGVDPNMDPELAMVR